MDRNEIILECAKAQCDWCRKDWPLMRRVTSSQWWHIPPEKWPHSPCHATRVIDLMDPPPAHELRGRPTFK